MGSFSLKKQRFRQLICFSVAVTLRGARLLAGGSPGDPVSDAPKSDGAARIWQLVTKYQYVQVERPDQTKGTFHLTNVDLKLDLDLQRALNWRDLRFKGYVLGNFGGAPSTISNDIQGASNIEAEGDFVKVYEAYLEKSFDQGGFSVLAGLRDLNADFYSTDSAGLFFNSSFGVGGELAQTGKNGPSIFPTTATAVVVKSVTKTGYFVNAGAFNAVAGNPNKPTSSQFHYDAGDGVFSIVETGFSLRDSDSSGALLSKVSAGMWQYSRPVEQIADQNKMEVNYGAYGMVEAALPLETTAFVRYGIANPRVNAMASNLSGGISKKGVFFSERGDVLGVGVTKVKFGKQWAMSQIESGQSLSPGRNETAIEVTYRLPVSQNVSLQPDFQRIVTPSGVGGRSGPVNFASIRVDIEI